VWRRTKNRLHLLHIPVNIFGASSFGLLYTLIQTEGVSISVGATFYLMLSLVFPFLILWAEEFTRRMRIISSTADFQLGLPVPSTSYQLLGVMGQLVQNLSRPIVAVQGPQKINSKIDSLAEDEPTFIYMKQEPDGRFQIDPRIVPVFEMTDTVKDKFVELVDFLVEESISMAGRIPKKEFEAHLKSRTEDVIERYSDLLIQTGLLDRLAGGVFSDRISTGLTDLDLFMEGGYPEHTAILLCGPPSDERNLLLDSFIGTGLSKGDPCIYVSSAQPPENFKRQFGNLAKDLLVVDCYTNRIREVDTINREGNVITSPIEISVVSVAISRGLDREPEKTKRAVVDILPTYLVFQTVEKLYLDLMEIIDDLRKAGYTTIFSLNPYYIKDEGAISTLEELFDGIMYVERTADSTGMRNEISLRIDKMAGQPLKRNVARIQKPEKMAWTREKREIDLGVPRKTDYTPVEA